MSSQADPTDPEVPNAKRKREVRRRRSILLLASAVALLVVVVLLLIYKTSRQVTVGDPPDSLVAGPAAPSIERPLAGPSRAPSVNVLEETKGARTPVPDASGSKRVRAPARPVASSPEMFRHPGF